MRDSIEKIENIRALNNHLWMNLLRLALNHAPEEAREILRAINENDTQISGLLKKIAGDDGDAIGD